MKTRLLLSAFISLFFTTLAFGQNDIITIAEARELPLGTEVTVTGWVTVTDEFLGPVYFQDETGGMAWYNGSLMRTGGFDLEVARGDSIVITGELGEFGASSGEPGTGLLQIVGSESDISFEFYPEGYREISPAEITIAQLNSGDYEGQLIKISSFELDHSGSFQGNTNYSIQDQTGNGQLRIDQHTNLPGSQVPPQPMAAIGVAGEFRGTAQILPRDTDDLDIEQLVYPGDDVPKDQTFDVVTWNIEWFGHPDRGPGNLDLQMNNVIEVITTIDADLYALQEIANEQKFFALVDSLEEYSGFWADYISQDQKMAYLFRTSVIDSVSSGALLAGQDFYHWAGRMPLYFEFDATVNGETRRIYSYNIHAKAFGDEESYNRRRQASLSLKSFLDNHRNADNVLFLGDYNDMLTESSFTGADSPYKNFVDDDNYYTITKSLEEQGFYSFLVGQFRSMIDHITVTNDLIEDHIEGVQRVENPNYISSYTSTTSDHAPVWTRFDFSRSLVSIHDDLPYEHPKSVALEQNYPNPFNPVTNISFTLPENSEVSLQIYDIMGREVAALADNAAYSAGSHTVQFDASHLSSGIYIYRLTLQNGVIKSRKMTIVK